MLIGSMNNPSINLLNEIKWIVKNFNFLDLTLEMPKAYPDKINFKKLKAVVDKSCKPVVGHTAWYLPIGSPFLELRMYSLHELEKCAYVLHGLGAEKMNVHFDDSIPFLNDKIIIDFNIWTLKRLVEIGKKHGIRIMAENTPGLFSRPKVLEHMFKKVPDMLLHLDIAHANIAPKNQTPLILKKLSKKLAHVHISDNHGKRDEHLPIGKGSINWVKMLGALKRTGYDGTITLEIFTSPEDRLADKATLRKIWNIL